MLIKSFNLKNDMYDFVLSRLNEFKITRSDIEDIYEWKNSVYTIILVKTYSRKIYRFIYSDDVKKKEVSKKLVGSVLFSI